MFDEEPPLVDRRAAGRRLAQTLAAFSTAHPVVFAAANGAVPVAFEVARAPGGELDLLFVVEFCPSAAAACEGGPGRGSGRLALERHALDQLAGLDHTAFADGRAAAERVRRRRSLALETVPPIAVRGRVALLVDDGAAGEAALSAALIALRSRQPALLIFAVPVAASATLAALGILCDATFCLLEPAPFYAAGAYYGEFHAVSDAEVVRLLHDAWDQHAPPPPPLAHLAP